MPRLLPVLGLPLVADGVLTLASKWQRRTAEPKADEFEIDGGGEQ